VAISIELPLRVAARPVLPLVLDSLTCSAREHVMHLHTNFTNIGEYTTQLSGFNYFKYLAVVRHVRVLWSKMDFVHLEALKLNLTPCKIVTPENVILS